MTMVTVPYRVSARRQETADTATLTLRPVGARLDPPRPGQFSMVYAFGVGEVPISVSGGAATDGRADEDGDGRADEDGDGRAVVHTIRAVGAVSRALHDAEVGAVLGLRGPFGTHWGLPAPVNSDLVVVGGGIGLAPLRPVLHHAVDQRGRYRRVVLLIGARTPADLLYTDCYAAWRAAGIDVRTTVDRAEPGWTGHVGVVTTLMSDLHVDPSAATAYVCGPEAMMRFSARRLMTLGLPARNVRVSLERNMRCGVALCGHCQLGGLLVCRDGPVVGYDVAEPLMMVKEL